MKSRNIPFYLAALILLAPVPGQAQSWKLLGSADLMMGQYYFKNSAGSINGYGNLDLQLARNFSSESGFFISGNSVYTGFKQVNELAGGGTLFQQSWSNSMGLKWIKRFENGFSLKPRVGLRSELFRETSDEKWGKGLYDQWRYEAGLTWERKTRWGMSVPWTYQLSYDFYYTHYPRFQSLADEYGAELATPDPGAHVLDTMTHQLSYRSEFDFPGFVSAWGLFSLALVDFQDQKVVNSKGEYLGAKRSDACQALTLGVSKRLSDVQSLGRIRPVPGVSFTIANLFSNQNNFDTDPQRLKYVGGYYNYWETHITPSISALFLKPMLSVRLLYDFAYRTYSGRLAQQSEGAYTSDTLYQLTNSASLEAAYPLLRNLDFKVKGIWAVSSSNTRYEQTYTYNYRSYNYFAGIEWKL